MQGEGKTVVNGSINIKGIKVIMNSIILNPDKTVSVNDGGELILNGEYGFMVGYKNREIVKVPLEEVAGKLKMVDPNSTIVKEAKLMGICFGD